MRKISHPRPSKAESLSALQACLCYLTREAKALRLCQTSRLLEIALLTLTSEQAAPPPPDKPKNLRRFVSE